MIEDDSIVVPRRHLGTSYCIHRVVFLNDIAEQEKDVDGGETEQGDAVMCT